MARSNPLRKIVTVAALGAAVAGTYQLGSALFGDEAADVRHLANQVWIERIPGDDRDMIHHLVLIEDGRDRFGAFGKSSQWRHFIEIFRWTREDSRLAIVLPQERKRVDLDARVWDCDGEAPAPFQLCLELTNKKGKKARYFSRYDWAIDGQDAAAVAAAHPELAPVLSDIHKPAEVDAADFTVVDDLGE